MNHEKLPKGYHKIDSLDLEDKKVRRRVNLLAMILAIAIALAGAQICPPDETAAALLSKPWVLLALLAVLFAYMVLHEVVHGAFIRIFTGTKPVYGMKSIYLYAGSKAYMDRRSHVITTLAPAVIFGLIFAVLAAVLPGEWFWPALILQIANIAGSAGDFYSVYRELRMQKNILIQDLGTSIKFYAPEHA